MFLARVLEKLRQRPPTLPLSPAFQPTEFDPPSMLPRQRAETSPMPQWENVLSPAARAWLDTLPPSVRPHHLADAFPRIAHRLALVWRDMDLVDRVLDDLLVDKRGGRRGFPADVSAELLRLHSFHERCRPSPRKAERAALGSPWDLHLQASADR